MRYLLIGVQLVATGWFGLCCALVCYYVAAATTIFGAVAMTSSSASAARVLLFTIGVGAFTSLLAFLLMYWMWRIVWVPMRGPRGTRRGWGFALAAVEVLACAFCAHDGYLTGVSASGSVPVAGGGMAGDLAPAIVGYQFSEAMIVAAFAVVPLVIMWIVRLLVASSAAKSSA